jgi:hypothetical protein
MGRGCSAAGFWLGWVALIVIGCAGFAWLFWIVFGWQTLTNYGLALAWTGLAVGLIGVPAESLPLPALLVAALLGKRRADDEQPAQSTSDVRRRGPGISTYIAGGLAALILGRLLLAFG